jgi:prepilin-type N-terminal cleavage/methylation domain-containing protein
MKQARLSFGFTIIELIIVLAIASLIFLIVFLALPATQRAVRDNQRRSAYNNILAQMQVFKTNNGHYPVSAADQTLFQNTYLTDIVEPNTGSVYNVKYSTTLFNTHNANPAFGEVLYTIAHWCASAGSPTLVDGDDITQTVIVLLGKLESAGIYCIDNK